MKSQLEGKSPFFSRAKWTKTFVLFPKKSVYSNKIIFMQYAYKGSAPVLKLWEDTTIYETYWITPTEHLLLTLKGTIK
jgi:hypothetical protein